MRRKDFLLPGPSIHFMENKRISFHPEFLHWFLLINFTFMFLREIWQYLKTLFRVFLRRAFYDGFKAIYTDTEKMLSISANGSLHNILKNYLSFHFAGNFLKIKGIGWRTKCRVHFIIHSYIHSFLSAQCCFFILFVRRNKSKEQNYCARRNVWISIK